MSGTPHHGLDPRALRDRVTAPSAIDLPAVGEDLVWRPVTAADIDLILDLERAAGEVDHPRSLVLRDELEEEFADETFVPEHDAVIALDRDGRAVAYGSATAPSSPETIFWVELDGTVVPDRRGEGIGSALLAWQEARGLQHLASCESTLPGWLAVGADERATRTIRLLEANGYERARWWLELERDLAAPLPELPSPSGVRFVPYDKEWAEPTRSAWNDAFRDHWGTQPMTAAEWAAGDRLQASRPDLAVLALAPDESGGERVVGFVLVDVTPEEWPLRGGSFGYISSVGVRREARGQGLARAMLAHVLRTLRAEGLGRAVLDVDAESPTGALGLYQSLGFTVNDRSVSLVKRF
ncbi:GNAT family N-acetyltransferase [Streptomyces sp. ML-6]|uniref:GNAT family N-acetyltransferase n=1 Tax=Streptomyces sp. ML-6 TaxID=2982693 RepID=UPI0024BFBAC7|nr:GNAT family N-acetyltransferase [Streptomyces sp. ML-6]MDK0524208.1 GNAT family N-acetyltransferase [Streptomyces sp. ML-6]